MLAHKLAAVTLMLSTSAATAQSLEMPPSPSDWYSCSTDCNPYDFICRMWHGMFCPPEVPGGLVDKDKAPLATPKDVAALND
jgi:hypothetical protein